MGLDQGLYWIGKPSKDMVNRLYHRNISELGSNGMNYIDFDDEYTENLYANIKKYMIPCEVYRTVIDWDKICDDCGMPHGSRMCRMSNTSITFGKAANIDEENHKTFQINMYADKYKKEELVTYYFFLEDEIYKWHNNYEIQDLFNKLHPEEWCDYENKYETYNGGMYKINKSILEKIKKIDPIFAERHNGEVDNIFYSGNW